MTRPKSDFEALRQDLHNVYDGDPWHGSSITAVLAGVDARTAALRSIQKGHTIWELVLHMASWTREVASRVRGTPPKSPEDWPVPKLDGGETAWRAAKDDLAAAQKEPPFSGRRCRPRRPTSKRPPSAAPDRVSLS